MLFVLKRCSAVLVILVAGVLIYPGLTFTAESSQAATIAEINRFVKEQIAARNIPGLALVITRGDEIVHVKGFGVTGLDDPKPVTGNTLFDLASITKSFTATAVLLLRDDGLIDLDKPVQCYLPDFELADPSASAQITVAQLLNHTSGFSTATDPVGYQKGDDDADDMEVLVASLSNVHLDREPGESFEYSNLNYSLLGAIIERVSGLSFEEFMQLSVFNPMEMDSTTLYPEVAQNLGKADGHQPMFGNVITRNIPFYRSAAPAGWVMSSAADMGRWLIMQLNGGQIDGHQVFPWSDIGEMHRPTTTLEREGEMVGYGMGWFSFSEDNGLFYIWHGGDTPNFSSEMLLVPEYELGVVVLINSQNKQLAHQLGPQIAGMLLGQDISLPSAPWWASWASLDSFATFLMGIDFVMVVVLVWYIWWLRRQVRKGKRELLSWPFFQKWRLHIWHTVLNVSPLVVLGLLLLVIFLVAQYFFGFNPYRVAVDFRLFSPPSIWWSSVLFLLAAALWALTLAVLGLVYVKGGGRNGPKITANIIELCRYII